MATAKAKTTKVGRPKKTIADTPPQTPAQLRKENEALRAEIKKLEDQAYCAMCGKHKAKNQFYVSSDPLIESGVTYICKACAYKIACRVTPDKEVLGPTKASVMQALEYLDKPFLNVLWDASYFESHPSSDSNKYQKKNIWAAYIKNVQMPQYKNDRWKDSDIFRNNVVYGKMDDALPSSMEQEELEKERRRRNEAMQEYETNRMDVIRAIGYDPFESYPIEEDKPMLYGSLISFIDEEAKGDGMKMRAIIQIVKTFNQVEKINNTIDAFVNDAADMHNNVGSLDKLSGVNDKLLRAAIKLAQDNGISINHNNNKSKGANTLSGKIKQLTEIGFRDAKVNTFDIDTCEGMRQVAELSEEARHKQIGYDENIAQEIKDIKVELVETLQRERDAALESMRLLLVENMDLKSTLKELQGAELNGV